MSAPKQPWGSNFSRAEIDASKRHNGLLSLELEFSRECNLQCIYCYASSGRKLRQELDVSEIYHVLEQAIALGARRIILLGGGEPMLYPHALEIMRFLQNRGIGMDLFSNGTLINRGIADELFRLGVAPVIKMNSLREDVQDLLAGVPGTFRAIQAGLANLVAAGYPRNDRPLGVETIICRQNIDELPEMWVWARERRLVPYFEMITFQGRARQHLSLNVTVAELHDLFLRLSAIDRERYGIEWEPHPPIAALSCNRHEYSCTVNSRGYVQPCTGVDLTIGNIRHTPLAEIVRGSPVLSVLRNVRDHIKGACSQCEMLSQCYGCRGLAYHVTGDFLAADPLCWRNPKQVTDHDTAES
ncbi:MAG: radical SAM/SPASM domain-containing protein [Lentisphaerae bacterium RIFOXYB12_FULL_65_16]|nr:MAG: radical SAM/SPASM domain-containing protein [Lentisphaerae bacterium RIFOXYA12_64_32]OGV90029.1 MAG: radical SAM/SPASM domain-containing protein [Lentisphaerae bacterium RIFOXYB12_FULL_65_16]